MSAEVEESQASFLRDGGMYRLALAKMRKEGAIDKHYVYREYHKMIRISEGFRDVPMTTETCRNQILSWTETREVFKEFVVNDEAEEERVLSGGKTSAEIEVERQALLIRARNLGIKADPSWSAVRLRRELGDKLDAPEPKDEMGALREKLQRLQEIADMQGKIAALEAQLSRPADDVDAMRAELTGLGVKVDGRWSADRLRIELERATAPGA
jgi:hypothetical protein